MTAPWITEPGVYDIPAEDYHRDPVVGGSLSSSGARKLMAPSCPALFKAWRDEPADDHAEYFDVGKAAHAVALGVGDPIEVIDADGWKTKAAREQRDAAYAAGRTPVLTAQWEAVEAMATRLREHAVAGPLMAPGAGRPEQTIVWRDKTSGVWCRALVDWLTWLIADYKGLALDTPIPTIDGWSTMGALVVGDQIFDASGNLCTVTAKSEVHWRTCYRVRFDDGSSVICDDEHLWKTTTETSRSRGVVRTETSVRSTDEIRRTLRRRGQRNHRIPVAGALQLPELPLPIDPYVLGVWIGDGAASCGRVTSGDEETWALLAERGYSVGSAPRTDRYTRTVYGLSKQLRKAGFLGHKRIPAEYLRGSVEQRTDLLCGLMDTDGSWNATRSQAVYTTTSKALAEEVRELALSLGQRAVIATSSATGFGKTVTCYRVNFTPLGGLVPFALPRKAAGVGSYPRARSNRRVVMAVDEMPTVPTQCITVDSPDSTYLCTEAMIPTHNTAADIDPDSVARATAKYGYHKQLAWYVEGAQAVGLDVPDTALLVVQMKTAPYLVATYQIRPDDMGRGHEFNRKARDVYRACTAEDRWPGFVDVRGACSDTDVLSISLPTWEQYAHDGAARRGDFELEGASL